jgi:serine/threonine protein kinase
MDPKQRITAKEALLHPWLNDNNTKDDSSQHSSSSKHNSNQYLPKK